MALEQRLQLKVAQRLVMTPSLQQAIRLLQLSRLELEAEIAEEMLENPMLEVESDVEAEEASEVVGEERSVEGEDVLPSPEETYEDIDVEAFFADYLPDSKTEGRSLAWKEPREAPWENILSAPADLHDHLLWQLHMVEVPERLGRACEFIVGNLDEDGYLRATNQEIQEATDLPARGVEAAVTLVRSLDPPGIASRTLQECLLAQLDVLEGNTDAAEQAEALERLRTLVRQHWDDLLQQRWQRLAHALNCDVEDMRPLIDLLHELETKPGRAYQRDDNFVVEPDVYVRKVNDEYVLTLNDNGLPRLRVNDHYLEMLNADAIDAKAASFLREKMRGALWLMKSIDQRQRTIYRVAESIVSFQRDFLEHGLEFLKPMVLRQVAEDVNLHESTVSRVVSNKYMYTPRGMFPMKFFFHSGVDSVKGKNVSSLVVKERIRKLVKEEDESRPLSDSKIMKALQREGIRLARRTVAKYREELGIPSSERRKRLF